jgi:hypothetical protein
LWAADRAARIPGRTGTQQPDLTPRAKTPPYRTSSEEFDCRSGSIWPERICFRPEARSLARRCDSELIGNDRVGRFVPLRQSCQRMTPICALGPLTRRAANARRWTGLGARPRNVPDGNRRRWRACWRPSPPAEGLGGPDGAWRALARLQRACRTPEGDRAGRRTIERPQASRRHCELAHAPFAKPVRLPSIEPVFHLLSQDIYKDVISGLWGGAANGHTDRSFKLVAAGHGK